MKFELFHQPSSPHNFRRRTKKSRLKNKLGVLSDTDMVSLAAAMKRFLDLP
jgi:hypothetical protein